ncbi:MAG: HAD family phosphatase [Ruminococcus sp.]|nr:HAD family phosphatase [Ruminococcus sp.]
MDYKAIIFDLDGTLVNSAQVWIDIDVEYEKKYNLVIPDDYMDRIKAMGFSQLAVYYAEELGVPLSPDEIKAEWYSMADDKYRHEIQLLPNAYEFIHSQHSKGVRMCIATANNRELTEAALTRLGVMECMEFVINCDEVGCGKDSPQIYLEAAKRMGADPSDTIVFEDIPSGIISAKNGGFDTCAVCASQFSEETEILQREATMYICGYEELLQR